MKVIKVYLILYANIGGYHYMLFIKLACIYFGCSQNNPIIGLDFAFDLHSFNLFYTYIDSFKLPVPSAFSMVERTQWITESIAFRAKLKSARRMRVREQEGEKKTIGTEVEGAWSLRILRHRNDGNSASKEVLWKVNMSDFLMQWLKHVKY